MGRTGWDRGRERGGPTAGREAVLERRTREVGRRTARLEGEQKGILLLPATESSLNLYPGREGEVGLPSRRNLLCKNSYVGLTVPGRQGSNTLEPRTSLLYIVQFCSEPHQKIPCNSKHVYAKPNQGESALLCFCTLTVQPTVVHACV